MGMVFRKVFAATLFLLQNESTLWTNIWIACLSTTTSETNRKKRKGLGWHSGSMKCNEILLQLIENSFTAVFGIFFNLMNNIEQHLFKYMQRAISTFNFQPKRNMVSFYLFLSPTRSLLMLIAFFFFTVVDFASGLTIETVIKLFLLCDQNIETILYD